MRTPAQVSGNYNFVTDVPVQGPTDPGMRAAACWWTQNVLPVKSPACVDCNGPTPLWANNPTAWGGGWPQYGGNGGSNCSGDRVVRRGSRQVAGFSLDGPIDPPATLSSDQQTWVVATLVNLNTQIGQSTGSSCQSWQPPSTNLAAAVSCFQGWYNANGRGSLRTDGVLDRDTLNALVGTAAAHPADFTTPFPAASVVPPPAPPPVVAPAVVPEPPPVPATSMLSSIPKLSTNAMIGIGVAATTIVVGGVVYVATRSRK